ncbi:MAG: GyrI-like domain-containing protein [Chloroflexi bacterium]|nr:GyrI-like domain-containing protein [Chloroflexota bacterium]
MQHTEQEQEGAEPILVTLPDRRVAYREMRGALDELPRALEHLQAWMEQEGLQPAADIGIAYFPPSESAPDSPPRWEVRCLVATDAPERTPDLTGCGVKALDSVTVAVVQHRGLYAEVGRAYARLIPWLLARGRAPGWPMEEVFTPDPDSDSPEAFITEVRVPIQG